MPPTLKDGDRAVASMAVALHAALGSTVAPPPEPSFRARSMASASSSSALPEHLTDGSRLGLNNIRRCVAMEVLFARNYSRSNAKV